MDIIGYFWAIIIVTKPKRDTLSLIDKCQSKGINNNIMYFGPVKKGSLTLFYPFPVFLEICTSIEVPP